MIVTTLDARVDEDQAGASSSPSRRLASPYRRPSSRASWSGSWTVTGGESLPYGRVETPWMDTAPQWTHPKER